MYYQSTRHWQLQDQYSCPVVQTRYSKDTLKNVKLHFKMLQIISVTVSIKTATKCIMICSPHSGFVFNIYFLLNCSGIP